MSIGAGWFRLSALVLGKYPTLGGCSMVHFHPRCWNFRPQALLPLRLGYGSLYRTKGKNKIEKQKTKNKNFSRPRTVILEYRNTVIGRAVSYLL